MKKLLPLTLLLICSCSFQSNPIKSSFNSNQFLKKVVSDNEDYQIQILLTTINNNKGEKLFNDFQYQLDEDQYFYPASTIKLPIVTLSLKKINELRLEGYNIDLKSKIKLYSENNSIKTDSITSFQNLIADVFLVSDNSASNVLIDFIGYNYFNEEIKKAGFNNTYLNHKFNPDPFVKSTWTISDLNNNIISNNDNQIIVKARDNLKDIDKGDNTFRDGEIIKGPINFSEKNRSSLLDMHNILKYIFYPEIFDPENSFNLNVEDYDFLRYWMSRFTYEDLGQKYLDNQKYFETYNKFFIHGDDTLINDNNIRVYNKIGQAYGTSIDNAFIKNYNEDIEFFLTATIYTNKNRIINDNNYEYDEIAIPFLANLSREIYNLLLD